MHRQRIVPSSQFPHPGLEILSCLSTNPTLFPEYLEAKKGYILYLHDLALLAVNGKIDFISKLVV